MFRPIAGAEGFELSDVGIKKPQLSFENRGL